MDLLTTLTVFSKGGIELNPVVRSLMPWTGPVLAVVVSKVFLALVVCLLSQKVWLVRFANIFYTGIVAWNISIIWRLK